MPIDGLGPCFGHEKCDPAVCHHPPTAIFAWYAEDCRGRTLVSICFACNTILTGAVRADGSPVASRKSRKKRAKRRAEKTKR